MKNKTAISIKFKGLELSGELFDTNTACSIAEILPLTIPLTVWGEEVYGPIGASFPDEKPQPEIPPGGIAYTNNGGYLCIFFGQTPAWPVEYVGKISGSDWVFLRDHSYLDYVTISKKEKG